MKEFRRVPMGLLMKKLGIDGLDAEARLARPEIQCQQVEIPLKQHTGVPAQPVVKEGESIHAGQLIGRVPDDQLGANIHASIEGRVTAIDNSIRIERT
jgi:Na+-translocating ferredoxin:NAD+ oxidoreductase RnfC subunit